MMMNKEQVSNELTVFESKEFGNIRTVMKNGEPWFVAADVCRALDIANNRDALTRLAPDEKDVALTDTPGGRQEVSIVSEPGLYILIMGSRKPSAKTFTRWITHDVIPSIRKHGMYATNEVLNDPDLLEAQARKLREERERKLNEENSKLIDDNKRLAAINASYETKLFIRDHLKDIFDFINKCVRSYAALTKDGKIGYGWKDYYDQLAEKLGVDIRERGKPYIYRIADEEMGTAIRVAGNISVRPVNDIVSDEMIELMKDIVRRVA